MTSSDLGSHYLEHVSFEFRRLKSLADKAIAQMPDEAIHQTLDGESNSVAVLMRHLSGNMLSRWTDFFTTDGEKPDRHRDQEFQHYPDKTREQLLDGWNRGWQCLFDNLGALESNDLQKTVTIRREPLTVLEAVERQIVHGAYHVGQIVALAKHFAGEGWTSLSIPRGQSESVGGAYKKSG